MGPFKPPELSSTYTWKERQVAGWLLRCPDYDWAEPFVSYETYEEWMEVGRKISHIEDVLADFLIEGTDPYPSGVIFTAIDLLAEEGIISDEWVPALVDILNDPNEDSSTKMYAVGALGIIGDPRSEEPICMLIESLDEEALVSDVGAMNTKINAMIALDEVGGARSIRLLEGELRKPYYSETEVSLIRMTLKSLQNKEAPDDCSNEDVAE